MNKGDGCVRSCGKKKRNEKKEEKKGGKSVAPGNERLNPRYGLNQGLEIATRKVLSATSYKEEGRRRECPSRPQSERDLRIITRFTLR